MSISVLSTNFLPNMFALLLCTSTAFVAVRAFYVYYQALSSRLFILGLSMSMISLTALADLISASLPNITLNTDWFFYIGQGVSLLFIMLSLFNNSDAYVQRLIRIQVLVSALLIGLCLLSPTLPPFSNIVVRAVLSGLPALICFGIFYAYISAFLKKQTRFSLFMGIAFVLLGLGYLLTQQYLLAHISLLDTISDVLSMLGLLVLFAAIFGG